MNHQSCNTTETAPRTTTSELPWNSTSIFLLRRKYGLTQDVLARVLNVRQQTVAEWEVKKYVPGPRLCEALTKLNLFLERLLSSSQGDYDILHTRLSAHYCLEPVSRYKHNYTPEEREYALREGKKRKLAESWERARRIQARAEARIRRAVERSKNPAHQHSAEQHFSGESQLGGSGVSRGVSAPNVPWRLPRARKNDRSSE